MKQEIIFVLLRITFQVLESTNIQSIICKKKIQKMVYIGIVMNNTHTDKS